MHLTQLDTRGAIETALANRNLSSLVGLAEDVYFDAKTAPGYDCGTAQGRFELAKDVVSFCNAEGGYIIIGLLTQRREDAQLEIVTALSLCEEEAAQLNRLEGVIKEYVYPSVRDLRVQWIPEASDERRGLIVVRIPRQATDSKPYLTMQVLSEGAPIKQIVVGISERRGSDSIPTDPKQLQQIIKSGMDGTARRLDRHEAMLGHLLELATAQAPRAPERPTDGRDDMADAIRKIGEL